MKRNFLIPYECGLGASTLGAEQGPYYLSQHHELPVPWFRPPEGVLHKNAPALGSDVRKQQVIKALSRLRDDTAQVVRRGDRSVTIGGDHSMGIGTIAGLAEGADAHRKIGVLWIDAHADLNTPKTSPTQAFHGMPLATLLGYGDADVIASVCPKPVLTPQHICIFGARDIDHGETVFVEKHGIRVITIDEIHARGIGPCFDEALEIVHSGTTHRALSVDLDAFSPDFDLATGTPVPGGFDPDVFLPVLEEYKIAEDFDVCEITELNPTMPNAEKTAALLKAILKTCLS